MDQHIEAIVRHAIVDASGGKSYSPEMDILLTVLRQYRQRRDGFNGIGYDDLLREYFGDDIARATLSRDDAIEVARTVHAALADTPAAREWVSRVVSSPEEPALVPLVSDMLDRMWTDAPSLTHEPLATLGFMGDLPEARATLSRWSQRADEAGAQARRLLALRPDY